MGSWTFIRPLAAVAFASTLVAGANPAWAANHGKPGGNGGGSTAPAGIDISYPQCPGTGLPSGEAFAIVAVNGGLANDYNPCLNNEFAYAQTSTGVTHQARAQLYLNTGDPGNGVADWPSPSQLGAYGNTATPAGQCAYASGSSGAGANSRGCAYIYGYDMVAGITFSGGTVAGDISDFHSVTNANLKDYPVWLDVETGNSWEPATAPDGLAMNVADLQGMADAIRASAGSAPVHAGVYSTSYQWKQITGAPAPTSLGNLAALPDWVPGATRQSGAVSDCSLASFTGGQVTITQWAGQTYDGDYSCVS